MSTFRVITGDDWKRGLAAGRQRAATRSERIRALHAAYARTVSLSAHQAVSLPGASAPGVLVEAGSGRGTSPHPDRLAAED